MEIPQENYKIPQENYALMSINAKILKRILANQTQHHIKSIIPMTNQSGIYPRNAGVVQCKKKIVDVIYHIKMMGGKSHDNLN